jgi:hypothetical protein
LEFSSHCSTHHNIKQKVTLLALMAATGKTEIWPAIFAAASNDFICKYHTPGHDKEEESNNDDKDAL